MGSAAEGNAFGASERIGHGGHRAFKLSRRLVIPRLGIQSESVIFVYAENVERSKAGP
jgi:hypothetical protein